MTAPKLSPLLVVTDVLVVAVLTYVATSPFQAAYGGWRWILAVEGGLLLGMAVALVSRRAGLGPWSTALSLVVVYLLLGSALALPEQALGGVLPDPDSLRALLTGVVHAWRDSLTLITPLGSAGTVLLVPYLVGLLLGAATGLVLWRSNRPGVAGLALVGAFVVAASFGDNLTGLTVARGLGLAIGLLVWTRWRATRDVRVSWPRRIALTTVVLVLAGASGAALAQVSAGSDRAVLRDHVSPPFDPLDYPSPLSRYRAYYDVKNLGEKVMLRATGLTTGDRIRIAAMDTFDGIVWNVAGGPAAPTQSGSFGRLSRQPDAGAEQDVSITIEDYSGPWVPTVGQTQAVEVSQDGQRDDTTRSRVLYNPVTGTMAQVGGVRSGATYSFRVVRQSVPSTPEELEAVDEPVPPAAADVPALTKRVQAWLASGVGSTGGGVAQSIADGFREGYYSDGKPGEAQSAAGHGLKRITDLVTPEQMIGNDEQYASAMGLAAQLRGLPARVVLGFEVPDSSGVVHGSDVTAWVEVHLEDAGWVAFEPTPDKDRKPHEEQEDPEPEPQPNVLQPPVVPDEPEDADDKAPQGAGKAMEEDRFAGVKALVGYVGYAVGGLALTSPLWALLLVKLVRRRRRRSASDPVVRVSGGWKEIADRARDLGLRLPSSNTRYENGVTLDQRFPASEAIGLATRADQHVFGPATPSDDEVAAYWTDIESALKRMRKAAPWWRRPIAVLSPASIPWRRALVRATGLILRGGAGVLSSRPFQLISTPLRRLTRRPRKASR